MIFKVAWETRRGCLWLISIYASLHNDDDEWDDNDDDDKDDNDDDDDNNDI